jgi:hypothetical protein
VRCSHIVILIGFPWWLATRAPFHNLMSICKSLEKQLFRLFAIL